MGREANGFAALSKTEQVCAHMESLIRKSSLKPGDRLLTESKLAERLNVSIMTVKRGMDELARRGIVYKAQGRGTFVAGRAVSEPQDAGTLNLIYPAAPIAATSDPFLAPLIDGIESLFAQRGCTLRLMPLRNGRRLEDLLKEPASRKSLASGAILVNYYLSERDRDAAMSFGAPMVAVGRQRNCESMPYVEVDHRKGGRKAAAHLLAHGRRSIVFAGATSLKRPVYAEIAEGIKEACESAGIAWGQDMPPFIPVGTELMARKPGETAQSVLSFLKEGHSPDAIIVFGSECARALADALKEQGVGVPKEMALISYTDFPPLTMSATPRITAMSQPNEELGRSAARLLLKAKKSGAHARKCPFIMLETALVVRESCGCR